MKTKSSFHRTISNEFLTSQARKHSPIRCDEVNGDTGQIAITLTEKVNSKAKEHIII